MARGVRLSTAMLPSKGRLAPGFLLSSSSPWQKVSQSVKPIQPGTDSVFGKKLEIFRARKKTGG